MTTLTQIIFVVLAIFLGWQLYRYIHVNPQMFSKENIGRSIFTLGILALLLIGFLTICVLLIKHY